MSLFFFFEYLVDGKEYATFLDIAKFIVDSGAEHSHRGRQAHVGMYQRRNIVAVAAYFGIEYAEIGLEVASA